MRAKGSNYALHVDPTYETELRRSGSDINTSFNGDSGTEFGLCSTELPLNVTVPLNHYSVLEIGSHSVIAFP